MPLCKEEKKTDILSKIQKRNGNIVDFDYKKIKTAILKAGKTTGDFSEEMAHKLALRVVNMAYSLYKETIPSVEDIQDLVEDVLITSPFKKLAKAYILYRDQHTRNREINCKFNLDLVDNYLEKSDWQIKENSNMTFSLQGLNNYISNAVTKTYWLNKIYTPEIREAHSSGAIHIHDLGLLSVYCVGWDLQDLLSSGFQGVSGKVECKPAKHFRSALGHVINFFYTLQGEAAGAQAFSNFDTLLSPFIRYDNLSYKDVKQALQEFMFNINVPTRVGFQTPFTNVSIDLQPPKSLANQNVIVGGEIQKETYKEFQEEMNTFNKAFFEVMNEGDAKGRVFTFPVIIYNISKNFNWENPALEGLWKITAKYGIPYFTNFVNSDISEEDVRSMCCRLRLDLRELKKRGGGLFGSNPLTGSIGVVTINMPRLGYLSHNMEEFFSRLDQLMEIARASLETKRKILETFADNDLYPYTKFYLRHIKNGLGKYWTNHFSTIGIAGLNEACENLLGCDIGSDIGRNFAHSVLDHMRQKLIDFQESTGNMYNLEATPAEGTVYRFAKIDKEKYQNITCANEKEYRQGAAPFYTNSSLLPVNYSEDIFQILDLQDDIQTRYTGGTILHIFVGEREPNHIAAKNFIRKICNNYHLPYFSLTPTFSVCPSHGYIGGESHECPTCGEATEVYSRVVGYLRPISQWNDGKKAEFASRKTFKIS